MKRMKLTKKLASISLSFVMAATMLAGLPQASMTAKAENTYGLSNPRKDANGKTQKVVGKWVVTNKKTK